MSIELSVESQKIFQTVTEIFHIWKALKEQIPNKDHKIYLKRKYESFVNTKLGIQLFYQIESFIDEGKMYDFNRLHAILVYNDRINRKQIKNEDASAHFEYSMQKEFTFNQYEQNYKEKIEQEYQDRFKNKPEIEKQNLFLNKNEHPLKKVEIEVKIVGEKKKEN
jgi:hypothetical protein